LDVLRGIAVLLVLVHHVPVPPVLSVLDIPINVVHAMGWAGVDLFFVLSGFLVGGLLLKEHRRDGKLDARRFITRRMFKIWPSYFAFLACYFTAMALVGPGGASPWERLEAAFSRLWPALVHLQNYLDSAREIGWLWSLGVEEHFYLVLPFAIPFLFPGATSPARQLSNALLVLTGVVLLGVAARSLAAWRNPDGGPWDLIFPSHLRFDSLFVGVVIAYVAQRHGAVLERAWRWRPLLAAACAAGVLLTWRHHHQAQMFFYPVGLTLVCGAAAAAVVWAHLASLRPDAGRWAKALAALGARSYSIYVWHGYFANPLANRVTRVLGVDQSQGQPAAYLHTVIYVAAPVLLGCVMYELVEMPAMRLRNKMFPSRLEAGTSARG